MRLSATLVLTSLWASSALAAPTVVIVGDSITAQNGRQDATEPRVLDRGYFNWANALLGQAFSLTANTGAGGERTDQILARLDRDVIARKPEWAFVLAGANDLAQNVPTSTTWSNLTQIWGKLNASGIRVVALTIPRTVTMTNASEHTRLNLLIRTEGPKLGVIVSDVAAAYSDPVPFTVDGIHPSARGALQMGQRLAATLRPLVTTFPSVAGATRLTGTKGTLAGTKGVVADGWTLTRDGAAGDVVGAKVRRPDGEWQEVNIDPGAVAASLYRNVTTGWKAGDTVVAVAEVEVLPGTTGLTSLQLQFTARTGGTTYASSNALHHESTSPPLVDVPGRMVLRTVPFLIPEGATTLTQGIKMAATSGGFRVGRVAIQKVAP